MALLSFLLRRGGEEIREEVGKHILMTMAQQRYVRCLFLYSDDLYSDELELINFVFSSTGISVHGRAEFLEGFYVGNLSEGSCNMGLGSLHVAGTLVLLHSYGHGLSCFLAGRRRLRLCAITWTMVHPEQWCAVPSLAGVGSTVRVSKLRSLGEVI